jgi:hypothetical protein
MAADGSDLRGEGGYQRQSEQSVSDGFPAR